MVPKNMEMIHPGEVEQLSTDDVLDLTVALQRVYLAVGKVITADEAREIVNRLGAGLAGSLPAAVTAGGS
jgi:hypothetical protein